MIGKAKAALLEFENEGFGQNKNEEMLKQVIKDRDNIIDELDRELLFDNNQEKSKKGSDASLANEGTPHNRY